MLPAALLQSLETAPGFDRASFEAVHAPGGQITSVRLNPDKPITHCLELPIESEVPWCVHGRYLSARPSFTLDPLFHAGAYYVQEASSMFLWHILKTVIGNGTSQKVLDLCGAPGGKSTLLASFFSDGLVVTNEVIKQRVQVLTENITKWGSPQVIVTNNDPAHFQSLPGFFDVMVVDAPCSGSGLFRRDPDAIAEWSESAVQLCSQRQQRILADALPALKEDGWLIYSTCSYSFEEDERIATWLIEEMSMEPVRIPVTETWGIVETTERNAYAYRFYPDKLKGEGFFAAVFRKKQDSSGYIKQQSLSSPTKQELQQLEQFIPLPHTYGFFKTGESIRTLSANRMDDLRSIAGALYIRKAGTEIGSIKGKDIVPAHELALSLLPLHQLPSIDLTKEDALQYLKRKDFSVSAQKGWSMVRYCNLPLGWIKVLPNRINNYYPAEWRILKE